MDIFQPSSKNRNFSHETSAKLRFSKEEWESRKRDPGTLAYNPHLKSLCSNISFLVAKCRPNDSVLYVGGSVSSYIFLLANMFPTLHFKLFDHNTSNFLKKAKEEGTVPVNLEHYQEVFSDQVAARLLLKEKLNGNDSLLISDLRNITRNAWGRGYVAVTDENVVNDLHLQENWVQLVRPRSADIKFKLPYHGASVYSYLKGQLQFQHFGKQSSSEARLIVDAPASDLEEYPRSLYNRHVHDDCLFHHNFVTRLEHLDAPNKVKLSYDQHMAHEILCEWMDKALESDDLSGISDTEKRKTWATALLRQVDDMYNTTLGLCLCSHVQQIAQLRDHPIVDDDEAVLAITAPAEDIATEEQKVKMQRLWKKNMNTDVERRKEKMQKQLESQIPV